MRAAAGQAAAWQANAEAWADFVRAGDRHREGLLDASVMRALGRVRGRAMLDAGCGEGRFVRRLAQAGARRVIGVDLSPRLIATARRLTRQIPRTARDRVRYLAGDAARLDRLGDGCLDAVLSYLSLMHFPDPGAALAEWARVLSPGGRLVVVLPHPFTQAPGSHWEAEMPPVMRHATPKLASFVVAGYFERRRIRFRFRPDFPAETWNEHRPLAQWSQLVARAGLVLERLWEPRPSAGQARRDPEWEPYRRQPYFLVLRAARAATLSRRAVPAR